MRAGFCPVKIHSEPAFTISTISNRILYCCPATCSMYLINILALKRVFVKTDAETPCGRNNTRDSFVRPTEFGRWRKVELKDQFKEAACAVTISSSDGSSERSSAVSVSFDTQAMKMPYPSA